MPTARAGCSPRIPRPAKGSNKPFASPAWRRWRIGELQRAFLAQVMAQDPNLLLLDEPGNHLDIPYQSRLFDGIARWLRAAPNRAAISVVHDLSLARAFGSHALLLAAGRQAAFGPVAQALSPPRLQAAYGMDVCAWLQRLARGWVSGEGS